MARATAAGVTMASVRVGESYQRASLDDAETDAVVIGSGIGGLTAAALLAASAGMRARRSRGG